MKTLGIVLIAAGILMMIFTSFSFTKEEKVIDLGPLEVNKQEEKTVGWPVYAGVIVTIAGIVILVSANKRKV